MKLPALTAAAAASLALLLALTLQPVAVDALSVGDLLNPFVRPNQYMTYMTPPLSSPTPPTNFRRRGFSFASFWVFPRTLLLLLFIFLFFPRWPRASTHEYRSRSEMCARRHVSRSRICSACSPFVVCVRMRIFHRASLPSSSSVFCS